MDQFYSLLCNCWKGDGSEDSLDIIFNLPPEMAFIILRLLDPQALVSAILVSKRWFRLIRSDRVLRKTVREELLRQREARMNLFYGNAPAQPQRVRPEGASVRRTFARKNLNKVAHGAADAVPAPARPVQLAPVRPVQLAGPVHPAPAPVVAARPLPMSTHREVFNVSAQAPQLSVPRQSYEFSARSGLDARRIKNVYTSQRPPAPTHSFAPSTEAASRKASKYRPSKKNVNTCKARPTSLRM